MNRYRKVLDNSAISFSSLSVGQSFTCDNTVYLKIAPCVAGGVYGCNAVRISAQATPGQNRFRSFSNSAVVYNGNMYSLVHESRLPSSF